MGIPGCGKSLSRQGHRLQFRASALPHRHDRDLLRQRHGKPEGAFVAACSMMEDMAPAVLWFDEIEMGITSTESGGEQGRIFAFFLTWMQEKTARPVCRRHRQPHRPAARRNDPQRPLRRSLLRGPAARRRAHRDLQDPPQPPRRRSRRRSTCSSLIAFTTGWTGAEIEQCVVSAITEARLQGRRIYRAGSHRHRRPHRPPVAHHEGTDQPHSRLGLRARRAGFTEPDG